MTFSKWLSNVVDCPQRHAKWLNTLSYLENCGARKIAACEHPTRVKEEMLKHAAEEFRHALHLKKQIYRLAQLPPENYALEHVLGGRATWHYLNLLEVRICRYLCKQAGFQSQQLQDSAYVLVTYAIELRAAQLYGLYDTILRNKRSKVSIKAIMLDEQEHLQEMKLQMALLPKGEEHAKYASILEKQLFQSWLLKLYIDEY